MKIIRLTAVVILGAVSAFAQYSASTNGSPVGAAEINSKPAIQSGSGAPGGNCTTGKDIYVDTTAKVIYGCTATNIWNPLAASGGVVTPESYGATGNGQIYFDGAVLGCCATGNGNASSTATAPAVTTTTANSVVLHVFMVDNLGWSSAPSTGTTRLTQSASSGLYSFTVSDQAVATAGSVGTVSGTLSGSTDWDTASIAIRPNSGTVAFVSIGNTQQSSGSTITVTAPAGLTNGDLEVACIGYYTSANSISARPASFSAGTRLLSVTNGNNGATECYSHVASSEPGTYTWTQTNGWGATAFVAAYRAAALGGNVFTSATANFTSPMAGYPICIAGFASSTSQTCTTISAVLSSTQVSLASSSPLTATGLEFRFGADDTTAFQTMLTSAPCSTVGCAISLAGKHYVLTGSLSLPVNVPVTVTGVGPGVANTANAFLNSNTHPNTKGGSELVWLTTALSGAALSAAGTSHTTNFASSSTLQGFSVIGGAGYNGDGGGADGLGVVNWQGLVIDRVYVVNFAGNGLVIDSLSTNAYDYSQMVRVSNCLVSFNHNSGVRIGSTGQWVETTSLDSNTIEANGLPGVTVKAALGLTLTNNVIQWNNIQSASSEVFFDSNSVHSGQGVAIQGNYIEVDNLLGSQSTAPINNAAELIGSTDLSKNYILPSSTFTPQNFTISQLPAGSTVPHLYANVSNADACTNGTTLSATGSVHCVVVSNGTNWIETGMGWQ